MRQFLTRALRYVLGGLALLTLMAPVRAEYPDRSITILVGYTPGTIVDIGARIVAKALSERLGQPVVVDNRPGASGTLAIEAAMRAPRDGYTLIFADSGVLTVLPTLRKLPFNTEKDLIPLAILISTPPLFVINTQVPAKTLQEFIQLAKAKPNTIRWGSQGVGTGAYMLVEELRARTGIEMIHANFSTAGRSQVQALLAGEIDMAVLAVGVAEEGVRQGKLRVLATIGSKHLTEPFDAPTMAESGFSDFVRSGWFGIVVPTGIPAAVADKLAKELYAIGQSKEYRDQTAVLGPMEPLLGREEFGKQISTELANWKKVIDQMNIKLE